MDTVQQRPGLSIGGSARVRPRAETFEAGSVFPRTVTAVRIDELRRLVDRRLAALSPDAAVAPPPLPASIAYSLLAPGKRMRPLMTMLAALQCGADERASLDVACATEMVHAASLIFDDLPSMDDASLRRGRPTSHVAFGEDAAILSAVSLLSMAFRTVAEAESVRKEARLKLVAILSAAVGPGGLVAGQIADLRDRAPDASLADIRMVNFRKTAALFAACGEAGVILAGGGEADRTHARGFAEDFGLAFQILDDLKDARLTAPEAGKDVRKDGAKPTVLSALGDEAAAAELRAHLSGAREHALRLGHRHDPLTALLDHCFPDALLAEVAGGARDGSGRE